MLKNILVKNPAIESRLFLCKGTKLLLKQEGLAAHFHLLMNPGEVI